MNDKIFAFTFIVIAFFVLGFTISRAVFKSSEPVKETASIAVPEPEEIPADLLKESASSSDEVAGTEVTAAAAEEIVEGRMPTVTIKDTPTGWLNVREGPGISYNQIKRINPGETYNFLEEKFGWYRIQLGEKSEGWIASQYAAKSE